MLRTISPTLPPARTLSLLSLVVLLILKKTSLPSVETT